MRRRTIIFDYRGAGILGEPCFDLDVLDVVQMVATAYWTDLRTTWSTKHQLHDSPGSKELMIGCPVA